MGAILGILIVHDKPRPNMGDFKIKRTGKTWKLYPNARQYQNSEEARNM